MSTRDTLIEYGYQAPATERLDWWIASSKV